MTPTGISFPPHPAPSIQHPAPSTQHPVPSIQPSSIQRPAPSISAPSVVNTSPLTPSLCALVPPCLYIPNSPIDSVKVSRGSKDQRVSFYRGGGKHTNVQFVFLHNAEGVIRFELSAVSELVETVDDAISQYQRG